MEQQQDTASEYYNKTRKRSFLYSRLTIMTSLGVLVIALVINISVLYSQNKSIVITHADTPQNIEKLLPSLPAGCSYQHEKHGLTISCPSLTPTITTAAPISINLPKLPPQCSYQTSTSGNHIQCTSHAVIPRVPVVLPTNCVVTGQTNMVQCTNTKDLTVSVPLPSLPQGCGYTKLVNKLDVSCQSGN